MQSPYQVDMKNIFKCWKDFSWYSSTTKYTVFATKMVSLKPFLQQFMALP